MMSSMFEIPILYVACDVKIVKKEGVIFLLTCTSKNTVTKETEEGGCHFSAHVYFEKYSYKRNFHVLAGFFFSREEGRDEKNRIEATGIFI